MCKVFREHVMRSELDSNVADMLQNAFTRFNQDALSFHVAEPRCQTWWYRLMHEYTPAETAQPQSGWNVGALLQQMLCAHLLGSILLVVSKGNLVSVMIQK